MMNFQFLPEKGMEIDLGAIAKGYIADRIKDFGMLTVSPPASLI